MKLYNLAFIVGITIMLKNFCSGSAIRDKDYRERIRMVRRNEFPFLGEIGHWGPPNLAPPDNIQVEVKIGDGVEKEVVEVTATPDRMTIIPLMLDSSYQYISEHTPTGHPGIFNYQPRGSPNPFVFEMSRGQNDACTVFSSVGGYPGVWQIKITDSAKEEKMITNCIPFEEILEPGSTLELTRTTSSAYPTSELAFK